MTEDEKRELLGRLERSLREPDDPVLATAVGAALDRIGDLERKFKDMAAERDNLKTLNEILHDAMQHIRDVSRDASKAS